MIRLLLSCIITILWPLHDSWASVSGACANCHVMHASQQGVLPAAISAPQESLLNDTCLGCHNGTQNSAPGTPIVYVSSGTELASGNFKYIDSKGDGYGHNPVELANTDSVYNGTDPPGWDSGFTDRDGTSISGGDANWTTTLTCAGTYGCHGLHSSTTAVVALDTAHHNNVTDNVGLDGTTVGKSFRFLYGIIGYEDDDYEYATTAVNHNVYYGEKRTTNDTPTVSKNTIGYLCAECHGIFHSGTGDIEGVAKDAAFASPWIRHPVDVAMPTSGEYSSYTAYTVNAPLATTTLDGAYDVQNDTNDRIVTCLSCHRAHASAYYGSLRWAYRSSNGTNACDHCHSQKD